MFVKPRRKPSFTEETWFKVRYEKVVELVYWCFFYCFVSVTLQHDPLRPFFIFAPHAWKHKYSLTSAKDSELTLNWSVHTLFIVPTNSCFTTNLLFKFTLTKTSGQGIWKHEHANKKFLKNAICNLKNIKQDRQNPPFLYFKINDMEFVLKSAAKHDVAVNVWWMMHFKLFFDVISENAKEWNQRNSRLSLMFVSTVFRWGLSSSSISSTPRTLIAPSALFKFSTETQKDAEMNVKYNKKLRNKKAWEPWKYVWTNSGSDAPMCTFI